MQQHHAKNFINFDDGIDVGAISSRPEEAGEAWPERVPESYQLAKDLGKLMILGPETRNEVDDFSLVGALINSNASEDFGDFGSLQTGSIIEDI